MKKKIPKIIHQTWKVKELPVNTLKCINSWKEVNPEYEFRFYDDEECLQFVKEHYPEYFDVYLSLSRPVEKADFFRYLVIDKCGGVYTDIDTTCVRPIRELIQPEDDIIVGIEENFSKFAFLLLSAFGLLPTPRSPAYCQWTFMSVPGHPILKEVIRKVAQNAHREMHTLEKTGPAVWTDAVVEHKNQPGVRIVSKTHFGGGKVWPLYILGKKLPADTYVVHHFASINLTWFFHTSWRNFHKKIIIALLIISVIAALIIFL